MELKQFEFRISRRKESKNRRDILGKEKLTEVPVDKKKKRQTLRPLKKKSAQDHK